MTYNEKLANRIRITLTGKRNVVEKEMFGGLAFLVNSKMCVGIIKDDLICRVDPDLYEEVLEMRGCRGMDFTGKSMKGWIQISEDGMRSKKEFDYWVNLALEFNKYAKPSKRKN